MRTGVTGFGIGEAGADADADGEGDATALGRITGYTVPLSLYVWLVITTSGFSVTLTLGLIRDGLGVGVAEIEGDGVADGFGEGLELATPTGNTKASRSEEIKVTEVLRII